MNAGLSLDHVQIAIPIGGEAEARRFFAGLLGLTETPKPADMASRGGCWFTVGAHQLHLGAEAEFVAAKKAHVALTSDELDQLRADLENAGYVTHPDTVIDGRWRFFTYDPFGNRIEFMDRVARA